MNNDGNILEIADLRKEFGGLVAVNDLSFTVDAGQLIGLIGPNGSGKTTVFNCIMSVHKPTSGSVIFDGHNVTNMKRHAIVNRGLARTSQHSNPITEMTLRENIRLFTQKNSIFAFNGGASDERVQELADRVGIEENLDEHPDSVPFATVRKLEFARSLATEPEMLLIDEPFAGLNAEETDEIAELIQELNAGGMSIVLVDHNMHGLMPIVERVVVLDSGQKIAEGPPDEVVNDESVQKAYLAGTEEELNVN